MIYGYARCSTNEDMQDISRQTRELKKLGCEKIFQEYESGMKEDREQLQLLLSIIVSGDTIMALEASRITRSTQQLINLIELIRDKHIKLVLGNMVIDCRSDDIDPMTKAMLQMMGVFAELERNMISQRVKSGLNNAKAKGTRLGRPETTLDAIPKSFYKHYQLFKNKQINITEFASMCNCSRPTIYKYIKLYEEGQ